MVRLFTFLYGCSILTTVLGSQTCCEGLGQCFQNGGVFKHLPSPSCIDVKYGLFTRDNIQNPIIFDRSTSLPTMDPSKRAIFIIHGYQNSMETSSMTNIKDALLDVEDANVVILDWKKGASNIFYPASAANTRTVGADMAVILDSLVAQQGFNPEKFWCIGFSLGAHACGFVGPRSKLGRITGLDPAGPWFASYSDEARLSKDDATLVDNIHTDGGGGLAFYGLLDPLGHVDFYPNRGYNQPGCITYLSQLPEGFNETLIHMDQDPDLLDDGPSVSCSHGRAPTYFTWSIKERYCFVSREICTDERNLPRSCTKCPEGICGVMGYAADEYAQQGMFYLETTSSSPYCRY